MNANTTLGLLLLAVIVAAVAGATTLRRAMMDTPTSAALANTPHQLRGQSIPPAGWAMVGTVPLLFAGDGGSSGGGGCGGS